MPSPSTQRRVGALSSRATINRPIRKRTTEAELRHAGVVRAADRDTGSADQPDDTVDPLSCREKPDLLDDGDRS